MKPSYWEILEQKKAKYHPSVFLKISCRLARFCENQLSEIGKKAIEVAEGQFSNTSTEEDRYKYIEILQDLLPDDDSPNAYSPIIWALQENTESYPSWYSAGIVAGNIDDLKIISEEDITSLIREELNMSNTISEL